MVVLHQDNIKSFNIEDLATFETVTKMKAEISGLRGDLTNQEKLAGRNSISGLVDRNEP